MIVRVEFVHDVRLYSVLDTVVISCLWHSGWCLVLCGPSC